MNKSEAQREPLKDVSINRKRLNSEMVSKENEAYILEQGALTPPHSFVHRSSVSESRTPKDRNSKLDPLSPELSSPIKPQRAKRMKSDQGRSSGVNTVEEFLDHLSDEAHVSALQDPNKKPPYSYAMMIVLSILQSDSGKLTLSQIYYWISSHFPYYKPKDAGWQNSIRHNLSLNEAFVKGGKSLDGKGHFWEIKSGYESKFFKNDEEFSFEEFKLKLQNFKSVILNDCYDNPSGFKPLSGSKSKKRNKNAAFSTVEDNLTDPIDASDQYSNNSDINDEKDDTREALADLPSSPQLEVVESHSNFTHSFANMDRDVLYYNEEYLNRKQDFSHGNHSLKMNHSHLGFNGHEFDDISVAAMSSPKFKKYTCSFNTTFEPVSPMNKLQVPPPSQPQSKTPVRECTITPLKFNIFSTPTVGNIENPNPPSSIRNLQSPSRLFEDFYASPVFFRNTSSQSIDDCMIQYEAGKTPLDSPRKLA